MHIYKENIQIYTQMDYRMRKEQLTCKNQVLALVQWMAILPYYSRLKFIQDALTVAGLNDKYIYILLEWILRHPRLEDEDEDERTRLLDQVYNLIEKKKNYDIKKIFVAHNFWFSQNTPTMHLPLRALPEGDIQIPLDMSGIENYVAISDMEDE